ncbi:MAG: MerR family transcriptional regulator [Pontixanthobacter sp.]
MQAQFEDGKDEGALRTIGEVSRALGIKTHVLRYWEQQFPMLEPLKRSGNRRYYRAEDVALIERIDTLVNVEGYTLKGAQQAIENSGMVRKEQPVDTQSDKYPEERDDKDRETVATHPISEQLPLSEVRDRLKALRDRLAKAAAA